MGIICDGGFVGLRQTLKYLAHRCDTLMATVQPGGTKTIHYTGDLYIANNIVLCWVGALRDIQVSHLRRRQYIHERWVHLDSLRLEAGHPAPAGNRNNIAPSRILQYL